MATLLALLAGCATWTSAQIATTTATISGLVMDSAGAVVPNATVTLESPERGITREFRSDSGGRYSFSQLPPATYSLSVKANGFETYRQNGIVLNAALTATQNITLTVGAESQSITITADAPQLNTENSNVAANLEANQIVELPLNMRNVYGLATLNSAVNNTSEGQQLLGGGSNSTDDADQDISFLNFAGGFFGTSAYLLDGSWDTDPEWGAVVYVPSVDAVQEFKVQNNSFTAQYGWSTGNVINVVTKGGTNSFHGSAWEFHASDSLGAVPYFSNSTSKFTRDQTGGSAGGPLYIPHFYKQREKTFIFGLFEYVNISSPSVSTYTVPDNNFRSGDFSEILGGAVGSTTFDPSGKDNLGRTVNVGQIYDPRSAHLVYNGVADTPSASNPYGTGATAVSNTYAYQTVAGQKQLVPVCAVSCWVRNPIAGNNLSNLAGYAPDPVGAKILSYYPNPKTGGLSSNYVASGTAPAHSYEYNVRVDQNFSKDTNGYFRYSYKNEFKTGAADDWGADDPAGPGNARPNNRWGMWAGLSHIFSPTFAMNIASGVQIWHETSDNQSSGFDPSASLGLPAYVGENSKLFPAVTVGSQSSMGPGSNDAQAVTNHGPIGTVSADFIKNAGRHIINFGFMGVEQVDSQHSVYDTGLQFNGGFTSGPDPVNASAAASGNGVAEMLLGVMDGANVGTVYNPLVSNHLLGEYVQDDWKVTHNLTFNLGFRYEIQTPDTYRHNVASIFNPNVVNPISYSVGSPYLGALQFLGPGNRYVYNMNHDNLAPRLGFSYQPIQKAVVHGGYGIFYPQSVTCCFPGDADGFSATTYANTSLNGGITPNPNISTSNPWSNNYAQITGNSNGEYQQLGNGVGSVFRSRPSPYVQQWLLGIQYALTPNDQLDVNYIGNRGIRMVGSLQYNQLNPSYLSQGASFLNAQATNPLGPALTALSATGKIAPSSCNLDNATVTNAQLLVPYPQYCLASVSQTDAPGGESLYNAMQVTFNHRVSQGLTALVSYTYSKFLDNVEGNNSWSYAGSSGPANNYNLAAEKSVDGGDVPQALVASYVYQLPFGRGKKIGGHINHATDAVLGGWELSGIASFKSGIPISISGADIASYGGNPRPDVVANPHLSHPTIHEWFNTGAFAYAQFGTFGTAPRYFSNLRGPRYQDWDTVLEKNWNFAKTMRAQFRFETFNTFNHPNFYTPAGTGYSGCDPNATSTCASNFGQINHAFEPRSVQLGGKFYW